MSVSATRYPYPRDVYFASCMRVGNLLVASKERTLLVDVEREPELQVFDVDLIHAMVEGSEGDFAVVSRVKGTPTEWHLFRHRGGFGQNVELWYPGKPEAGLRVIVRVGAELFGIRESRSEAETSFVKFGHDGLEVVEAVPVIERRWLDVVGGSARLGDGTWIVIFDGDGYELKNGAWTRTFELGIESSHVDFTSAPGASDGFYYLSNRELFYAQRGAKPERLMPDTGNVMGISPGPDGSLLTWLGNNKQSHVVRVFYPEDGTYIPLIKKHIAPDDPRIHCNELAHSEKTGLMYLLTSAALYTIPWTDIQTIKRVKPRNKPGHKRSAPAKLKKQLAEAVAAPVPEANKPEDPLEAVVLTPSDLDAREVLADVLQEQGDRHGELIALGCRAARAYAAGEPFDETALNALEKELRPSLLERWNDPIRLFADDVPLYAGFPATFRLVELLVNHIPAVDAQLARIPISQIEFRDLGSATSKALKLQAMQHVTQVTLSGSSRAKMSRAVARALIKSKPQNLASLRSYKLELDGPILKELFNVCPKLTRLSLADANLTAEAMIDVAQAGSFNGVTQLRLMSCGGGSGGIGAFLAAAPNCTELEVRHTPVDDELMKFQAIAPLESLVVSSTSSDLTGKCVTWFLKTFPRLSHLDVSGTRLSGPSVPGAVSALQASTLKKLAVRFEASEPAVTLAQQLPSELEALALDFDGSARFRGAEIKAANQVLQALANNSATQSLRQLELKGAFSEGAAIDLVQSRALANLEELSLHCIGATEALLTSVFQSLPGLRKMSVWYPSIGDVRLLRDASLPTTMQVVLFASKHLTRSHRLQLEQAWGEQLRVI